MVRKGFLKEVTFTQELKELAIYRPRLWGVEGQVMTLRYNQGKTAEAGNKQPAVVVKEQKGGSWDMSGAEKGKMRISFSLSCLFVSFTHFSDEVLAFFLLICRSPLCVPVISPLSYTVSIFPNLSSSLNNVHSILSNQNIYLASLFNLSF